jgi:cytochrome c2
LFWIVSHGLKMSGMPGFDERLNERDRWATVAFVRRVVLLTPTEYQRLARATDAGTDDPGVPWVASGDLGFQQMQSHGNAARGKDLLSFYGCNSCHTIPGVGSGAVGPPLADFAERQYVAGLLVNTPRNLETWIRNPKAIKPITAMPNLNVAATDTVDIAAYLYTQGSHDRVKVLKEAAGQ